MIDFITNSTTCLTWRGLCHFRTKACIIENLKLSQACHLPDIKRGMNLLVMLIKAVYVYTGITAHLVVVFSYLVIHDYAMTWKSFWHYWPFVRGSRWLRWIPLTKRQQWGSLIFLCYQPEQVVKHTVEVSVDLKSSCNVIVMQVWAQYTRFSVLFRQPWAGS